MHFSAFLPPFRSVLAIERTALVPWVWGLAALVSCTVPMDNSRNDQRQVPARGAIRGTILYEGPRPCSRGGKIVGSAVVLVYPKASLPAPFSARTRPVNFTVVSGEDLFPNEPRYTGSDASCPSQSELISVSAGFAISPMDAGEYVVTSFYERAGNFLPSFTTHNQPEGGDILGGYMDVEKTRAGVTPPPFFAVVIGNPDSSGVLKIPDRGFVADSILVSLFQRTPFVRPIFHPSSSSSPGAGASFENPSGNEEYVPVVTMTQDHRTLAFPQTVSKASMDALEKSYVSLRLSYGLPDGIESDAALALPFNFDINGRAGFSVFRAGGSLPEVASAPSLWPTGGFARLVSDPMHLADPQGLKRSGSKAILFRAITLLDDSLFGTTTALAPALPARAPKDHLSLLIRPHAICLPEGGGPGVLVTPHRTGRSADTSGGVDKPLFDDAALIADTQGLANEVRIACLPMGRYAITLAYPTGQTWATPNESGSCAESEGAPTNGVCQSKPRPVLTSQGTRAVLEIIAPTTPEGRAYCDGDARVIDACLGAQ
jgi:hypothetical protein